MLVSGSGEPSGLSDVDPQVPLMSGELTIWSVCSQVDTCVQSENVSVVHCTCLMVHLVKLSTDNQSHTPVHITRIAERFSCC